MKKLGSSVKKIGARIFVSVAAIAAVLFGMPSPVYADDLLPDFIDEIISALKGGGESMTASSINDFINNRVKMALTILFVVVFIVAIVYAALAAIKFISSQGDASKLEESKAAIKAILMGFASMILAIIGIFAVIFILGGTSDPGTSINVDINSY